MRKPGATRALVLALSLILCTTVLVTAQTATSAKNPWVGFNKGSWVKMKMSAVTEVAGTKNNMVTETKQTLLDKTADKVVVEIETTVMGTTSKTKTEIPLKGAATGAAAKAPVPKTGSETITVAGKSLACKTYEIETEANGSKTISKTWMADAVPGGMAKSVSTTKGNSMTMTATTEVVDFKAM